MSSRDIDAMKEALAELRNLYWALVDKLNAKRSELISIEYRLQQLGWPGFTAGAYISAAAAGSFGIRGAQQFTEAIDALLRRRQVLIAEIEQERAELTALANQIHALQARITQMALQRAGVFAPKPGEVEALFRVLQSPYTTPEQKEMARKRLRDLGYEV
jgi:DNA repair exonuclease SbcCD ATPase subunit